MTEHPRSVEAGGVGTTPSVAARQETSGASVMRSPRGLLGSIVLVLSLPVAVLTQVLFGSGSSVAMHVALAVGCALVALSAFDFETPRWVAWTGCLAAGVFAAIFLLQAASELLHSLATSNDPEILARVSTGLGEAMRGLSAAGLAPEELLESRGW